MKYAVVQYLLDEPDTLMELFGPFDTEEQAIEKALELANTMVEELEDCIETPEDVEVVWLKDDKFVDYPFATEQFITVKPIQN